MKTAISIPDRVFREADEFARRTKKSRSRIYCEAVKEYLARHTAERVTEAMNSVCSQVQEAADPFVAAAGRRALERSTW